MLLALLFSGLLRQAAPLPPDTALFVHPTHGIGLALGGHLAVVDQAGFRLAPGTVGGLYFFHDLSDGITLQWEVQGKIVQGYRLSTAFEDYAVAPGGSGVGRMEFHLRSLFFLETPLLLKFRHSRSARHTFLAGVRPSVNIITSDPTGNYTYEITNGVYPADLGYLQMRQGLRRYDMGLSVGWNYAFSPRLSLDMRYTQGLFDLTADNFFKSKSNTLNSDLQVTLRTNF